MKTLFKMLSLVFFALVTIVFGLIALHFYGVNDIVVTLSTAASISGFYGIVTVNN